MSRLTVVLSVALAISLGANLWLIYKPLHDKPSRQLLTPDNSSSSQAPGSATATQDYPKAQQANQKELVSLATLKAWLDQGQYARLEALLSERLKAAPTDLELLELEAELQVATRPLAEALIHYYGVLERPMLPGDEKRIRARITHLEQHALNELKSSQAWDLLARFTEPLFQRFPGREDFALLLAESYARQQKGVLMEDTLAALPGDDSRADAIRALLDQPASDKPQRASPNAPSIEMADYIALPLTQVGDQFIAPFFIGGRRIDLLLDTGASTTAVSQSVFYSLPELADGEFVGVFTINTAGGPIRAEMVTMPVVSLGPYTLYNTNVLIVPDQSFRGAAGLLGMNVLKNFHFQIDQRASELILQTASPDN